jgi:hypothetical protein
VDLPQQVADELGIGRPVAAQALSALFMSVRMAVDPKTFAHVSTALPDLDDWLRGIQLAGGRTGEVIALAGPEALGRQLKLAGLNEQQAQRFGQSVGKALAELLPKDVFEKVVARVPLLKS